MTATERARGGDSRADEGAHPPGARELEPDVEEAFGAHDIEYWVRRGNQLVPATEEDIARIRAWESQRVARSLAAHWEREERRPLRRWLARCRGWLRRLRRGAGDDDRRSAEVAAERPRVERV